MGAGDLVLEPGGHLLALHVGDVVVRGRAGRRRIHVEHEAAGLGDEVREAHVADVRLFLGVAHLLVLTQGLHGDAAFHGRRHIVEGALPPHVVVHLVHGVAHTQVLAHEAGDLGVGLSLVHGLDALLGQAHGAHVTQRHDILVFVHVAGRQQNIGVAGRVGHEVVLDDDHLHRIEDLLLHAVGVHRAADHAAMGHPQRLHRVVLVAQLAGVHDVGRRQEGHGAAHLAVGGHGRGVAEEVAVHHVETADGTAGLAEVAGHGDERRHGIGRMQAVLIGAGAEVDVVGHFVLGLQHVVEVVEVLTGDLAHLGNLLEGPLGHVLLELVPSGDVLVVGAAPGRIGAGVEGHRLLLAFRPHHDGIDLGGLAGHPEHGALVQPLAELGAAHVHAGLLVDEVGGAGVVQHEILRVGLLVHEALDEAEEQGRVVAHVHGNPLVGFGHSSRIVRIDDHDFCANILGVKKELRHLDLGKNGVSTEHDDVV